LANALLSANNTTDPAQGRFFSYTFSPADAGAPKFPSVAAAPPAVANPNYTLMPRNIQNPYSQQAGVEVEQQLSATSTLGISYQYLRGLHLISSINTNINVDGTRPDPTRGNVKPYSSIFDSYCKGRFPGVLSVSRIPGRRQSTMSESFSSALLSITSFPARIAAVPTMISGTAWSSMQFWTHPQVLQGAGPITLRTAGSLAEFCNTIRGFRSISLRARTQSRRPRKGHVLLDSA
jgi:hypothetical protein